MDPTCTKISRGKKLQQRHRHFSQVQGKDETQPLQGAPLWTLSPEALRSIGCGDATIPIYDPDPVTTETRKRRRSIIEVSEDENDDGDDEDDEESEEERPRK